MTDANIGSNWLAARFMVLSREAQIERKWKRMEKQLAAAIMMLIGGYITMQGFQSRISPPSTMNPIEAVAWQEKYRWHFRILGPVIFLGYLCQLLHASGVF